MRAFYSNSIRPWTFYKPVKRFENGSDVAEFRGLDNSTSNYRITIVEFGVNNGSCNDTGSSGI